MSDDESEDQKHHIIIDNGSGYIKAGFSGEEGPYFQLLLDTRNIILIRKNFLLEQMQKQNGECSNLINLFKEVK